mgnify:FL=1
MKNLIYLQLFDAYGPLLTEHQRELCELYYMCDLSLTEIAEQKGVSKQSVSDTLAKSRALLDAYEEKLHHNEINQRESLAVSAMLTSVLSALETFERVHPEYTEEIEKIVSLLQLDTEHSAVITTRRDPGEPD